MLEVRYTSPENVKYKLEMQRKAYIDWAKVQLKNQKSRRKKEAHRKAKIDRKLDHLLASKIFDNNRANESPQLRKISLPVQKLSNNNLLIPQISQQDVMDLVSYTPAPTMDEKNAYDHRRQSKEGQLTSFDKYVAIPIKGKEAYKRTLPADSRSISPEVSALLLHSALHSPQDGMTKRSTLLETISGSSKKAAYNEAYFKNVRRFQHQEERMLQIYKAAPNVFQSKKKSTQEKKLVVKTSLGKDSLLFGDLSEQSPHFRRTTFPQQESERWKDRSPRSNSK